MALIGMAENVGVRWHHWLSGHEFEQMPGDSERQRSLACCSPRGRRVKYDWVTFTFTSQDTNNFLPCSVIPLLFQFFSNAFCMILVEKRGPDSEGGCVLSLIQLFTGVCAEASWELNSHGVGGSMMKDRKNWLSSEQLRRKPQKSVSSPFLHRVKRKWKEEKRKKKRTGEKRGKRELTLRWCWI